MSKSWTKLVGRDFKVENPSWEPSMPTARITVGDRDVALTLTERIPVSSELVTLFRDLIRDWEKRVELTAKETEKYLQKFLPGKRLSGSDLLLFAAEIYIDADEENEPTAAAFYYKIGDEYSDPKYRLTEFNADSTVELQIPIEDGEADWTELDLDVINDF